MGASVSPWWEVEVLDSVIAQQRMAAAAHVRPSVPFLPLILGARPATHTKVGRCRMTLSKSS